MDRASQGGQCGTLQSHWRSAVSEAGKDGGPERREAWEQSVVGTAQEPQRLVGLHLAFIWGGSKLSKDHTHVANSVKEQR